MLSVSAAEVQLNGFSTDREVVQYLKKIEYTDSSKNIVV